MKIRMNSFFMMLILCLAFSITAFSKGEGAARLVDMADLLDESEEDKLLAKLNEISVRQQLDIVVVTTDTLGGKTPMEYADDFYDENDYGFGSERDGILLLVSMEDRDWRISTTGYGITVFTDAGMDYLSKQFLPYLSDGDYVGAFQKFATECDDFITQAKAGQPYDTYNYPKEPFAFGYHMGISLLIGFVSALVITLLMKSKMKSVRFQPAAAEYIKNGSMRVTESRDLFLYSHVDRRAKPKNDSSSHSSSGSHTHSSSSGRSHGGGGGKF